MTIGPAGTVNTNVPLQNSGGASQEQVDDFKEAVSQSTTSSNASGMPSSKGEHTSEHSQDTSKSLPFVLATRPPINLGSPTGKQGAPLYDTQGKGSKAGSETRGNNPHSSENATKPVRVADNDQPNTRTRTTGSGAGPQSNPIRVLPHIHLEDHHEPNPRKVSMQDDCDFYKGKADALVFMEHGGFYNSKQSCKAGPSEPVAILGSECHVTINRNGSNVAHHTGIWFIDSKLQSSSGLSCGASPKDEKAAVVKAGGLLAFHHPEYTYIEDTEKHKDKTPSATALKYTLPKDQAEPFDMIEVWNKGGFTSGNVENVLKWTERNFYDRGLFPAAISGMDDHGPDHKKPIAFTMIDSGGSTDRDTIKAAVQAGKTWVSTDQDARVSVDTSKKGEATFNLSHLKPGSTVEIIQDGKSLGKQAITGDSFSSTVKGSSGYAYAKVYDANKDKPDPLYLITSAAQLK